MRSHRASSTPLRSARPTACAWQMPPLRPGLLLSGALAACAFAQSGGSITDTHVDWPTWGQIADVLTLRDYNTRVVVIGTMLLGLGAGVIGTFMLLRKRALMGDALSHATLPGIGLAFIAMTWINGMGKWLPGLLAGALISGAIGMAGVLLIRNFTRLKEDAALGIVLSVFFGLGIAILGVIQRMDTGSAAGLESFIYGKTASMLAGDAKIIAGAAALIALGCGLLFKEFELLCFDEEFARAQGWPRTLLDAAMMTMVVIITVIGLQAVGLILMIALLVIPPAAARFWTHHLGATVLTAAGIGAFSGWLGAAFSALVPRLPAGAVIVLMAGAAFALSMIFGRRRGVLVRLIEQVRLNRSVARQHLLRALFELSERRAAAGREAEAISSADLLAQRSWSPLKLARALRRAERAELVCRRAPESWTLTPRGDAEARRLVRNHRLWELFLITHADIAPSHVDRDADELEHVLEPAMVRELEELLAEGEAQRVPVSPHAL